MILLPSLYAKMTINTKITEVKKSGCGAERQILARFRSNFRSNRNVVKVSTRQKFDPSFLTGRRLVLSYFSNQYIDPKISRDNVLYDLQNSKEAHVFSGHLYIK